MSRHGGAARQAIESRKPMVRDPSLFETQRTKDFQDSNT
jgi:hypothetical protein